MQDGVSLAYLKVHRRIKRIAHIQRAAGDRGHAGDIGAAAIASI
jgi:hypothetical protein